MPWLELIVGTPIVKVALASLLGFLMPVQDQDTDALDASRTQRVAQRHDQMLPATRARVVEGAMLPVLADLPRLSALLPLTPRSTHKLPRRMSKPILLADHRPPQLSAANAFALPKAHAESRLLLP